MPPKKNNSTLLIKSLRLRRIRCFEDIQIDFHSNDRIRRWSLILGNNGLGKTTLLRCLALGLCDSSSAAALERELYGDLIRAGTPRGKKASIEITLASTDHPDEITITTSFKTNKSGYTTVSQAITPNNTSLWDRLFVCGYGAARRMFGTNDLPDYGIVDAVYTLFNYDAPLQNPELVLRRISSVSPEFCEIALRSVDEILLLKAGATSLTHSGLTVAGHWGSFLPVGSLGDGYQATLAWIFDFFGQAMLFDQDLLGNNLSGIILLDELEQHLHPIWQREIIQKLSAQFPKVQFICTSHSPLCAGGLTDLPSETSQLLALIDEGATGVHLLALPSLKGLRSDQIVTSLAFGASSSRSIGTEMKLLELRTLYSKENRSSEEDLRLQELSTQFEQQEPEAAEDEDDRQTRNQLLAILSELNHSINKQDT